MIFSSPNLYTEVASPKKGRVPRKDGDVVAIFWHRGDFALEALIMSRWNSHLQI
jgi:hypothetical protein